MAVLTGMRRSQGRRTVAAAVRHSGDSMAGNGRNVHQVLNRARWSPLAVSRHLLLLIVDTLVPAGASVDLVIDETLERRWGSTSSTRGHARECALSRTERSVRSPGRRWIVMAVVVSLPWTKQRWTAPCVCVLATAPDVRVRLGTRHTTIAMWAQPMLSLVRRWLPDRGLRLMGEIASRGLELGWHAHVQQVTLITTGRPDAVLHEPPPERTAQTMGRPGIKGSCLPALEQVLLDPATSWQTLTLEWSGEGERPVQRCSGTALWDRWGDDP